MEQLIQIHLGVGMFLAGMYYQENGLECKEGKFVAFLVILVIAVFGPELALIAMFSGSISDLKGFLQIKSYWLILTGKMDNLDDEQLGRLNHIMSDLESEGKKTLQVKHQLFVCRLILKRQTKPRNTPSYPSNVETE